MKLEEQERLRLENSVVKMHAIEQARVAQAQAHNRLVEEICKPLGLNPKTTRFNLQTGEIAQQENA